MSRSIGKLRPERGSVTRSTPEGKTCVGTDSGVAGVGEICCGSQTRAPDLGFKVFKIGEQPFYDMADGALVICLARKLTQETLRGLMARKPKGVICLDIAFAGNDQLKANTVLEMKSHTIEFHTA